MSARANNQRYTAEMQATFAKMNATLDRVAANSQKQSALQSVLASWADALGDLGQNGAAFVVLWGCGRAVGVGCQEWGFDFAWIFNGAGWVIGGVTVAARVILDLGLNEFRRTKSEPEPAGPQVQTTSVPVEIEMGLEVDDGRGGWVTLLYNVPRHRILKMAHATARGYFRRDTGKSSKNFSQDHLGRFWGVHLNSAKERLAAAEKIELGGNNTYTFTASGEEWLERILTER